MNFVLFFILLMTAAALACEVTLAPHLVVLGGGTASAEAVKLKDCPESLRADLTQLLSGFEGRISSNQLAEMISQKGHSNVSINPFIFQIRQLKTLIREQLELPQGVQVKSTSGGGNGFLALAPGDKIEIACGSCLYGSMQPLQVMVRGFDGQNSSHHVRADFRTMVRAFRITTAVPAFSQIQAQEALREEYVESIPHTGLITDLESLRFYKTNKPLRPGELLRSADLNALNLVKAGLKTEVVLESSQIRIKTEGISRGNGSLGELVEVFHPQKNRKYQGKVIDVNKVLVEL